MLVFVNVELLGLINRGRNMFGVFFGVGVCGFYVSVVDFVYFKGGFEV